MTAHSGTINTVVIFARRLVGASQIRTRPAISLFFCQTPNSTRWSGARRPSTGERPSADIRQVTRLPILFCPFVFFQHLLVHVVPSVCLLSHVKVFLSRLWFFVPLIFVNVLPCFSVPTDVVSCKTRHAQNDSRDTHSQYHDEGLHLAQWRAGQRHPDGRSVSLAIPTPQTNPTWQRCRSKSASTVLTLQDFAPRIDGRRLCEDHRGNVQDAKTRSVRDDLTPLADVHRYPSWAASAWLG